MIWETLEESLIFVHLNCADAEKALEIMGSSMQKAGYVKPDYVQALIERERKFPTGLDMQGIGVAIPHTDAEYVKRSGIAVAALKNPVYFEQMGEEHKEILVDLIFLLAVQCGNEHLEWLKCVLHMIQDPSVLQKLRQAEQTQEIIQIIREKEQNL